jgi:uncharacterized protein GlcG (DUF336 family)
VTAVTWVWRVVLLVIALLALLTIPSASEATPTTNEHEGSASLVQCLLARTSCGRENLTRLIEAWAVKFSGGAQTASGGSTAGLTLADAVRMIAAAHAEAGAKNLRLTVAVVNQRGDVIAVGRMDGANPGTIDTAIGKAMVSAMFGQPSAALVARSGTPVAQGLNVQTGGRLRFLQGALPIVRGGFTVGAIASSGASAQQDEDAVRAALASMGPG